ncbi:MAG: hypothetical protein H7268_13375 [Sandarakinorhabdus sp.]|nr:hypothetical protein [Sandarakinorhabdus sp.]
MKWAVAALVVVTAAGFTAFDFRDRLPPFHEICVHIPRLHVPARYRDNDFFVFACPWQISVDPPAVYFGQMLLGEHGTQFYPSPYADRIPDEPGWWFATEPSYLVADAKGSKSADGLLVGASYDLEKPWYTVRVRAWKARRNDDFRISGTRYSSALLVDRFVEVHDAN